MDLVICLIFNFFNINLEIDNDYRGVIIISVFENTDITFSFDKICKIEFLEYIYPFYPLYFSYFFFGFFVGAFFSSPFGQYIFGRFEPLK